MSASQAEGRGFESRFPLQKNYWDSLLIPFFFAPTFTRTFTKKVLMDAGAFFFRHLRPDKQVVASARQDVASNYAAL